MRGVATLTRVFDDWNGDARLYRLAPPAEDGTEHVIVSAVIAYSGPETYIFAADESGEVTDWGERDGSFRGGLDHAKALLESGYSIAEAGR